MLEIAKDAASEIQFFCGVGVQGLSDQQRRDLMVDAVRSLGLECAKPRATFYIWAEVPKGYTSVSFTERVIKETGVVITPGSGFGKGGEGFVRFSLTVANERLKEAVERIKALRF